MSLFKSIALTVLAATVGSSAYFDPQSVDQSDDGSQMRMLSKAAYVDQQLWLLSDDGQLVSLDDKSTAPTRVQTPGRVRDLCATDDRLIVITEESKGSYEIHEKGSAGWQRTASVETGTDQFVALSCVANRVSVLTSGRLIEVSDGKQNLISLTESLQPALVTSTAYTADGFMYVGLNAGEWGGGLKRIDRKTGKVATIARNASGKLCGGPLNADCDPVNGLAAAPGKPGCVIAAIGLVHFMPHGRIVEVCGDKVERVFFKPFDTGWPDKGHRDNGEPASTVAFYGLVTRGEELWAVGIDGIYQFRGPGPPEVVPLPNFKNVSGYWVSFDLPDVALALTSINQRAAISGAVPMAVPRWGKLRD